jgi:4-hydroxybenzoyl-CoA thioesterase
MARVVIDLPEKFVFATEVRLLGTHMNMDGHLDNALLLTLVSESRVRYWQALGYATLDLDGVRAMVADASVQYKSEAHVGEVMLIEQSIRDFNKYGFDIVWRVSEKASGREVARGKTGIVAFDRGAKKIVFPPEPFLQRLHADAKRKGI